MKMVQALDGELCITLRVDAKLRRSGRAEAGTVVSCPNATNSESEEVDT